MKKLALAVISLFATLSIAKHSNHHHHDKEVKNLTPNDFNKKVVAYFPERAIYDRKFHVSDLPANKITHINYASARISQNLEIEIIDKWAATDIKIDDVHGNFGGLRKLKTQLPNLKTLINVGGWKNSDKFSDVAASHENRVKFAASVVRFIKRHGFDGVDLDWQYPVCCGMSKNKVTPEDGDNYVKLVRELRKQFD